MNGEAGLEALMREEELPIIKGTKIFHLPKLNKEIFLRLETYLRTNHDLEVKWIPKSDRLISVTGYEDQVIDPKIREAILHEDSTAAEVLMPL